MSEITRAVSQLQDAPETSTEARGIGSLVMHQWRAHAPFT